MSYILDALNKAEQARKQGETVVQSRPTPAAGNMQQQTSKRILLIALLSGTALLLFWFGPWHAVDKTAALLPVVTGSPVDHVHNKQGSPQTPARDKTAPIKAEPAIEEVAPQITAPAASSPSQSQPEATPNIMALPQEILAKLPAITISAHTYSEAEDKRMVIINNKVLHENRFVAEQLVLKKITRQGIELAFDGVPFSMTTRDSWPY